MSDFKKITESTLIPISLVFVVCSFAYSWAKLDSRIESLEKKSLDQDKLISIFTNIDRRLYRLEIKSGIQAEPLKQGE
jgi:uncharacterized coiled-coil protein SlyX